MGGGAPGVARTASVAAAPGRWSWTISSRRRSGGPARSGIFGSSAGRTILWPPSTPSGASTWRRAKTRRPGRVKLLPPEEVPTLHPRRASRRLPSRRPCSADCECKPAHGSVSNRRLRLARDDRPATPRGVGAHARPPPAFFDACCCASACRVRPPEDVTNREIAGEEGGEGPPGPEKARSPAAARRPGSLQPKRWRGGLPRGAGGGFGVGGGPLRLLLLGPLLDPDRHRRRDEPGRVGAGDDADQHGGGEVEDGADAIDEQADE